LQFRKNLGRWASDILAMILLRTICVGWGGSLKGEKGTVTRKRRSIAKLTPAKIGVAA